MTDFNALMGLTAKLQVGLLGGVKATYQTQSDSIPNITVIIDRDVDVIAENGMTTVRRTVVSLQKSEVGVVESGHKIITATETLTVQAVMSDDGTVVEVYTRG